MPDKIFLKLKPSDHNGQPTYVAVDAITEVYDEGDRLSIRLKGSANDKAPMVEVEGSDAEAVRKWLDSYSHRPLEQDRGRGPQSLF